MKLRRNIVSTLSVLLMVFIFFSQAEALDKMYFPHIASGNGWETEVCVINTESGYQLEGVFKAYSEDGVSLSGDVAVSLMSNGRRQIVVGDEFQNPGEIGYMVFEVSSGKAVGYTKFWMDGRFRVAVPSASEPAEGDVYISHIASDDDWWTGISLLNTNSTQGVFDIRFNDGTEKEITLAANEHKSFTISQFFDGLVPEGIVSAVIKNGTGLMGLELFGSRDSTSGNYLSGILLKDQVETTLYYPHIASDDTWWTGIAAYNPNESQCDLSITPYEEDGTRLSPVSLSIEGGGKYLGTASGLDFPESAAWLKIEASSPITGFELFGVKNGAQLAGYTSVGIASKQGIFAKNETEGWTGISLVNTEVLEASVTLLAHDDLGEILGIEYITLKAHEKRVETIDNLFSGYIQGATYIRYFSDKRLVGFQLNGSSDNMMLDGLAALGVETDDGTEEPVLPPDLLEYDFNSVETRTLPGGSTEEAEGFNCTGVIEEADKIGNLALVATFYENGCYTGGEYNHNDYKVERGSLSDTKKQHVFDAYKIHEPSRKANQFLASEHVIYYKFPKAEDYTVWLYDGVSFTRLLDVKASSIDTNSYTELGLQVSSISESAIYLFVPAEKRVSVFTELAQDVEGALISQTELGDVYKYRYSANGAPFDTALDYNDGLNHWGSFTRQFFTVNRSDGRKGVVWQDKKDGSIKMTLIGTNPISVETVTLPRPPGEDLAAATGNNDSAVYYVTVQSGSGAETETARTATLIKYDGFQIQKSLDTSKEGLDMVSFGTNVASLEYSNIYLCLIIGRTMHESTDGLNHQGGIAAIFQADSLKQVANWGQTSGHSFESVITKNDDGEFIAMDLGDNYPRGINLHKITGSSISSKVVYTFKTRHGSESANPAGESFPIYDEISGGGSTFYQWSNDNCTYTELGGIHPDKDGYTILFTGEPDPEGKALNSARTGEDGCFMDPRNIGLVRVVPDFENSSGSGSQVADDLVLSSGPAEQGGYYSFTGDWKEQRNAGVLWLTNYQDKELENASRLKVGTLYDGSIFLAWETWTAGAHVSTYAMTIDKDGTILNGPVELGKHVRLNRRDDLLVIGDEVFMVSGDKKEEKLEMVVFKVK